MSKMQCFSCNFITFWKNYVQHNMTSDKLILNSDLKILKNIIHKHLIDPLWKFTLTL